MNAVYLGILVSAVAWSMLSAVLSLGATHEAERGPGCFWRASFALSSLAAAWSLGELL